MVYDKYLTVNCRLSHINLRFRSLNASKQKFMERLCRKSREHQKRTRKKRATYSLTIHKKLSCIYCGSACMVFSHLITNKKIDLLKEKTNSMLADDVSHSQQKTTKRWTATFTFQCFTMFLIDRSYKIHNNFNFQTKLRWCHDGTRNLCGVFGWQV